MITFYNQFLFSLAFFLGEAVNLLLRGANGLNNSKNNVRKVSMLCLLKVNERGHIPYGKKRAFILNNATRLPAFI